jgi:hypothetical protein
MARANRQDVLAEWEIQVVHCIHLMNFRKWFRSSVGRTPQSSKHRALRYFVTAWVARGFTTTCRSRCCLRFQMKPSST